MSGLEQYQFTIKVKTESSLGTNVENVNIDIWIYKT